MEFEEEEGEGDPVKVAKSKLFGQDMATSQQVGKEGGSKGRRGSTGRGPKCARKSRIWKCTSTSSESGSKRLSRTTRKRETHSISKFKVPGCSTWISRSKEVKKSPELTKGADLLTSIVEDQETVDLKEEIEELESRVECKDEEIFQLQETVEKLETELSECKNNRSQLGRNQRDSAEVEPAHPETLPNWESQGEVTQARKGTLGDSGEQLPVGADPGEVDEGSLEAVGFFQPGRVANVGNYEE